MTAPANAVRTDDAQAPESRRRDPATPAPSAPTPSASSVTGGIAGPSPLPDGTRQVLERGFGADLGGVRVHTDERAATAARELSARAVTVGSDIFLGAGERPTDVRLMAHEVAHVVQQGRAPAVQLARDEGADPFEREAGAAATAVLAGGAARVTGRVSAPRLQRWGLSDVLDWFADKANIIPGFRMFTVILGLNPINMRRVERSAANILRALIEFMPGGYLITQALDNLGVFDRAGAFVERQVAAVGLSGASIRKSITDFIDSLGWRDLIPPWGGVWNRAKRIVTDPIERLFTLAKNVVVGIVVLIKDAILRPLARLAQGTPGYDLLRAVLGRDPITGEAVPQTADALIGGFMKLIRQEEVWNNLKRANAVARAFAWFKRTLAGVLAFVRQIPATFVAALRSLELADIVLVTRAFGKLVRVFGAFVGNFISWAGGQVLSLLQIIFEVLAPAVMPYLRKAMGAFREIIRNPVGFIRNLVRAGVQGFRQFAGNFLNHLKRSIIDWLTGSMQGANLYYPKAFELREIVRFVLSVLGLTWDNIRSKLVRAVGEPVVATLEKTFDTVVTFVREGPAAAWQQIRDAIGNVRDMVMDQVMAFVRDRIVTVAVQTLVTSLNPAGAFIQAVLAIYNTIMFLVERLSTIGRVLASFIDSIAAIAAGGIGTAASRVETTMAGLLTLVISFLARLVRLGNVSDAVKRVIDRIRQPIDKALDKVIEWIVSQAKRLGRFIAGAVAARPTAPVPGQARGSLQELARTRLAARLRAEHDPDEVRDLVGTVFQELRPMGVRALEPAPQAADGSLPIMIEASPRIPFVRLVSLAQRRSMRSVARIVLDPAVSATTVPMRDVMRAPGFDLAVPQRGVVPGTAVFRGPANVIETLSWNTSSGREVEAGSHAETQFTHFLERQPWRDRVTAITVTNYPFNPCRGCARNLAALVDLINADRRVAGRPPVTASLTWDGDRPWTWEAIGIATTEPQLLAVIQEGIDTLRRSGRWAVTPGAPSPAGLKRIRKAFAMR